MSSKLDDLVNQKAQEFSGWIKAINDHNSMFDFSNKLTSEERINLTYGVSDVLGEISELYFRYGGFKDSFDNSMMALHMDGPELLIKSDKTETEYKLGLGSEGIYLQTWMKFGEHLRHMNDSFYQTIFELSDLGEFDIETTQYYNGQEKEIYKPFYSNNKSKLFKLLRNYFVGIVEEERDILLGDFKISWGYDTNFNEVVSNGCLAFKALYKLNYSLWKIEDSKLKKIQRKTNAETAK